MLPFPSVVSCVSSSAFRAVLVHRSHRSNFTIRTTCLFDNWKMKNWFRRLKQISSAAQLYNFPVKFDRIQMPRKKHFSSSANLSFWPNKIDYRHLISNDPRLEVQASTLATACWIRLLRIFSHTHLNTNRAGSRLAASILLH